MPSLASLATKLFSALGKEKEAINTLHEDVQGALARLYEQDPGLRDLLERSHAYVVFPSVGKATAVIGGAYGKGEVYEGGKLVGYAGVAQLTIGVQIGGQTFSEVIAFEGPESFERFKQGKYAFAANASAVLVKAGAAATSNFEKGAATFVYSDGGMMLVAAIGGLKFFFRPAVLGRANDSAERASGQSASARRSGSGSAGAGGRGGQQPRGKKSTKKASRRTPGKSAAAGRRATTKRAGGGGRKGAASGGRKRGGASAKGGGGGRSSGGRRSGTASASRKR